jgi:hypothetical protein
LVVLVLVLVQALALVGNLLSCWRGKARERSALPLSGKLIGKGKREKRKAKGEKGERPASSPPLSHV